MASTITTTVPRSTPSRRVTLGWAAAALAVGGVVATTAAVALSDDGPSTSPAAATTHRALVVGSADAAEHWALTDRVVIEQTASADAAERRAVAEHDRQAASCRSTSADAAERCAQAR